MVAVLVVTVEEVTVVVRGDVTVVTTVLVVVATCVVTAVVVIVAAAGPGTVVVTAVRLPVPEKYPTTPTNIAMATITPMAVAEPTAVLLEVRFIPICSSVSVSVVIDDATGAQA
jgi:hypothetical protein